MALSHSPRIVTDGLVLCFDAANPKSYPGSGITWGDMSGLDNNTILFNGPTYNTSNSGSIVFDGSNDYGITTSSVGNPSVFPDLTHIVWFYPTSAGQIIVELGQNSINTAWHDSNIEIDSGGVIRFSTWHGSLSNRVTSSAQSFNRWYQLAMTYRASTQKCEAYINGVSIGTTTFVRQYSFTGAVFYAFCANDSTNMSSSAYAGGGMSLYMFYRRELAATEILDNFNCFRGRFGL
jgi:hypothetical protein